MINVNNLKSGTTFKYNNEPYLTIEANHSKSGRGQAIVKVKAKNLFTNSITILSFIGGNKIEKAMINKEKMQFLYEDYDKCYFMNQSTYEQISIQKSQLEWKCKFLTENIIIESMVYDNKIIGIQLPDKVDLKVTEAEDGIKGDSASRAEKKNNFRNWLRNKSTFIC